jgi:chromosome segregation ATPase
MKSAIPWVLVVVLLGGVFFLYSAGVKKDQDLAQAQADSAQAAQLKAENEELGKLKGQAEESARLRKDNADLPRLRSEVQQLRDQVKDLTKKLGAAQAQGAALQQQHEQVSSENEALRAQAQQNQQAAAANAKFQAVQANVCIRALRQIQTAKQQWAQDNGKGPDAVASAADLLPYLPQNTFPVCPGGGNYTIGAVQSLPQCSVPGHVLQ